MEIFSQTYTEDFRHLLENDFMKLKERKVKMINTSILTSLKQKAVLLRACLIALWILGCSGDSITNSTDRTDLTDPTDVRFDETAIVFIVNPVINDLNEPTVPKPGTIQSGVDISVANGPSGTTGTDGVLVLGPVPSDTNAISLVDNGGNTGEFTHTISENDMHEVAVAIDSSGVSLMASVVYQFSGDIVEITPEMFIEDVNDALAQSDIIVLLRQGTYTGDLEFSGSNVTLFGEGFSGGNVTIDGNITVSGSENRIRGAHITGDVTVSGSDAGISFSTITGEMSISGSDVALLNNHFLGTVDIGGSGTFALGNLGMNTD